jgi:hypothetical protein
MTRSFGSNTRTLKVVKIDQGEPVEETVLVSEGQPPQSVNLKIEFDTNSYAIRPESFRLLSERGKALTSDRLREGVCPERSHGLGRFGCLQPATEPQPGVGGSALLGGELRHCTGPPSGVRLWGSCAAGHQQHGGKQTTEPPRGGAGTPVTDEKPPIKEFGCTLFFYSMEETP